MFALVVGESTLNDVVSIGIFNLAMSNLLVRGADEDTVTFTEAVVEFCAPFGLACVLGVVFGLGTASLSSSLHQQKLRWHTISSVKVLVPFLCYAVAEKFSASGIVAILICGCLVARDKSDGTSTEQIVTEGMCEVVSNCLECVVFVQVGTTLVNVGGSDIHAMRFAALSLMLGHTLLYAV